VSLTSGDAYAAPACSLEIAGVWRSGDTAPATVLTFTSDGWANVVAASPDQRPEDLDILAQVRYELEGTPQPQRLVFFTRRGNDVFPPGESSWEIAAHDDESFVAATQDTRSEWTRVQTHRYFLTFADREGDVAGQGALSLVALTSLDGRVTEVDALGAEQPRGEPEARFGSIRADTVRGLGAHGRESDVVLRVEVNAAEYRRSHRMLEAWGTLAGAGALADDDPYRHALDFLQTVLVSVNRCRPRVVLGAEEWARLAHGTAPARVRLRAAQQALRKENAGLHVADSAFPAQWKPPPLALDPQR
jgi:hypothetical protein